jgi:hypothetical protein
MSDIQMKNERPDDGNWRMLSGRELDYLGKIEEKARRADQLSINFDWLMAQFDLVHDAIIPEHIGTWQDRVQQTVKAVARPCSATCTSHVTHPCEKCGQQHGPRKRPSERLKALEIQRLTTGLRYFAVSDVAKVAEELEAEGL